jgi:hypothetical protein
VVAIGRASGGTPDTPEFSAQPKMRPNEVLPEYHIFVNSFQGEALYPELWVKFSVYPGVEFRTAKLWKQLRGDSHALFSGESSPAWS